jgi:ribosomal protein S27AE
MAGWRSGRPARRRRTREQAKLARDLERLARLGPGGSADRPIAVRSPSQVDVIAERTPCPLCGASLRLVEHGAARGLRVARVACAACGVKRALWFRLERAHLH